MSFTALIFYVVGGVVELGSLIACADFLGILQNKRSAKNRILVSMITYTGISLLEFFLMNTLGDVMVLFPIYFLKLALTMYVLFQYISKRIIYLIAFWDLSISLLETSTSCILANIMGKYADDISPFVKMFFQIVVLVIILFIRKKSSAQRNMFSLAAIPRHIFIMLILAIISLSSMSSLISLQTDNRIKKENTLTAIVIILTVILLCIIASLFFNVIAKRLKK